MELYTQRLYRRPLEAGDWAFFPRVAHRPVGDPVRLRRPVRYRNPREV